MIRITYLIIIALIISGSVVSCDRQLSLAKPNYVWSEHSTDGFNGHLDGVYGEEDETYYVVLSWHGKGQVAHMDEFMILCLKKKRDCSQIDFELEQGVAVQTENLEDSKSGKIVRLRRLDSRYFSGEPEAREAMVIAYNGPVMGKSNFDEGTDLGWLQFRIRVTKNRKKAEAATRLLYSLLQQEEEAEEFCGCVAGRN